MRAVIQRARRGRVTVDGRPVAEIGAGAVILLGVGRGDGPDEARWLAEKTSQLRIYQDDQGKMNRSLVDCGGEALVVSQFTLYADTRNCRRPSFLDAADPDQAEPLVRAFAEALVRFGVPVRLVAVPPDSLAAVPEAHYRVRARETHRSAITSMRYLREIAGRLRPEAGKVRWHVEEGEPIDAILSFAHRQDVDVIVISTHGRTGLSWLVKGSRAEMVATATHRPVMLVKPDRSIAHAA